MHQSLESPVSAPSTTATEMMFPVTSAAERLEIRCRTVVSIVVSVVDAEEIARATFFAGVFEMFPVGAGVYAALPVAMGFPSGVGLPHDDAHAFPRAGVGASFSDTPRPGIEMCLTDDANPIHAVSVTETRRINHGPTRLSFR